MTILISTGEPAQITVPRVAGMRGFDARQYLRSLGLTVVTERIQTGNPNQVGYVVAQEPASQTQVIQGSTVTIFVGIEPQGNGNGGGGGGGGNGNGGDGSD